MKKLITQIIKFGGVGAACFVIETVLLWLIKQGLSFTPLSEDTGVVLAKGAAFCLSMVVNYILSVHFVFDVDNSAGKAKNFAVFIILGIVGLGINMLIMCLGNITVGADYYILTHVFATGVVLIYNFITRKLLLEKKEEKKQ